MLSSGRAFLEFDSWKHDGLAAGEVAPHTRLPPPHHLPLGLTDIPIPLNSASNFRLPTSTSTQPTTSPPRHTRKMATMQLQKTRMAQTKTKTAMTQKQSLEVVQTLLHGGVSCAGPMQTACFLQSSEC